MKPTDRTISQYSTINALMNGLFDGDITCGELCRLGNFGLGTFNGSDGEMILLNGKVYQAPHNGRVVEMPPDSLLPYAVVTHFESDTTIHLAGINLEELEQEIYKTVNARNRMYAIKITGRFNFVRVRSIPAQQKPYPNLVVVSEQQNIFEYEYETGTLVGFFLPDYMQDINLTGFHFHFLSNDFLKGGHLLNCTVEEAVAEIGIYNRLNLILPELPEFGNADLNTDLAALHSVEKDKTKLSRNTGC